VDATVDGGSLVGSGGLGIEELEALRVPLAGFCYRLLGSAADTDDAVQETLIRASSRRDQYDPARGRLSTWVHAIAANVCLDMLRSASRRALVIDLDQAFSGGENVGPPRPASGWLDPMPDARVIAAGDPGEVVQQRESVRLAFIAALQWLPPRQRAVLVLRDVLAFTAQETASILDASVPSVNSALQRARALLADRRPDPFTIADPDNADQRDLLRRYVAAFEAHDVEGLKAILRADAVASMPPVAWRLDGGPAIAQAVGASEFCAGARLVPCRINGGWGFGQYRPGDDAVPRPFALVAVEIRGDAIAQIVTFLGSERRFGEFDLPDRLPAAEPAPR
jgi:RNA polymerase sigma-70 factor (TIGR02960 family)